MYVVIVCRDYKCSPGRYIVSATPPEFDGDGVWTHASSDDIGHAFTGDTRHSPR